MLILMRDGADEDNDGNDEKIMTVAVPPSA